jgi:two-component system response regulator EvgA
MTNPTPKILLIDDSTYISHVVSMLLATDFEVDTAYNTAQMLEKIAANQYALALLDLDLQDGVPVTRLLSRIKRACSKVIVFSQTTRQADFDACMQAAVDGFLTKNGDITELRKAAQSVLAGYQFYPQPQLTAYAQNDEPAMPILDDTQTAVLTQVVAPDMPTNGQIGRAIKLHPGTVANVLTVLFLLFGVKSRVALRTAALARGFGM